MHLALITESPGAPAHECKNKHCEGVRQLVTIDASILLTNGSAAWGHYIRPVSHLTLPFSCQRFSQRCLHVFWISKQNRLSASQFISWISDAFRDWLCTLTSLSSKMCRPFHVDTLCGRLWCFLKSWIIGNFDETRRHPTPVNVVLECWNSPLHIL